MQSLGWPSIPCGQYRQTVLDAIRSKALSKATRPGLRYIPGGGWMGGAKEQFAPAGWSYLEQGFVAANI